MLALRRSPVQAGSFSTYGNVKDRKTPSSTTMIWQARCGRRLILCGLGPSSRRGHIKLYILKPSPQISRTRLTPKTLNPPETKHLSNRPQQRWNSTQLFALLTCKVKSFSLLSLQAFSWGRSQTATLGPNSLLANTRCCRMRPPHNKAESMVWSAVEQSPRHPHILPQARMECS